MSARPQYSNSSQATLSTDRSVGSIPRVYSTAKRVVVPATVRATPVTLNQQNYRHTYSQTYCNVSNHLESVGDDKEAVRRGIFDSAQRFCQIADKSRGLRHFSAKVCEKVKEKGTTNYNEVADELVSEYFDSFTTLPQSSEKQQYDMKNIRRRVYDALNVLMAMNVIEKEKKEIRWIGLPTSSLQECRRLNEEKLQRQESIQKKTEQLQELISQLVAYKTLVQRNRDTERKEGRGPSESMIFLPFIVLDTNKDTVVDCSIASNKTQFLCHFDQPFEIHNDIEVLNRLGLTFELDKDDVSGQYKEHIRKCLPPALRCYADQIIEGTLLSSLTPPVIPKITIPKKKVPVIRAVAPAQIRPVYNRYNVPAKTVAKSRRGTAVSYRQVVRGSGQPYVIPPSNVYGHFLPRQTLYVQRVIPKNVYIATNLNGQRQQPQQQRPTLEQQQSLLYEEIYDEEYKSE